MRAGLRPADAPGQRGACCRSTCAAATRAGSAGPPAAAAGSRALSRSAISRSQGLKAQVGLQTRPGRTGSSTLYLDGFHPARAAGRSGQPRPGCWRSWACSGMARRSWCICALRERGTDAWAAVCEISATRGDAPPALRHRRQREGAARRRRAERGRRRAIQRCTVHKLRNLLTHAPRRLHDKLRDDYHAIVSAEDRVAARRAYTSLLSEVDEDLCGGGERAWKKAGAELLAVPATLPAEPVEEPPQHQRARTAEPGVPTPREDRGKAARARTAVPGALFGLVATRADDRVPEARRLQQQDMAIALTGAPRRTPAEAA